jgi:LytS/YehU family sensor histidine kinase
MQSEEKIKLNDLWLRIFGVPIIALQFTSILNIWEPQMQSVPFFHFFLVNCFIVFVSWQLCRPVLVWSHKKYKGINLFLKRFFIAYAVYFLIALGVFIIFFVMLDLVNFHGLNVSYSILIKYQLISMFNVPFISIIYEARLFFSEWKKILIVREELKRETLQSQLDSVKGQINPEFLFSNLNTVSTLIRNKNKNTSKFVDELSSIYRYVLQGKEKQLTELCDELKFVSTYEFLLKEKYGEGVQFEINIPKSYYNFRIPTLTMQILIDNALKDNIITPEKPLQMKFSSETNQSLVVINNLLSATSKLPDKDVLDTIQERYEMLGIEGIKIEKNQMECKVTLPLLN